MIKKQLFIFTSIVSIQFFKLNLSYINNNIHQQQQLKKIRISSMQNQVPAVKAFQSDKQFMRTLLNAFGSVIVFIFHSQTNEDSAQFLNNFINSITIFGSYDNVKYFSIEASKCPQTFNKFQVQTTPTVVITQTDKKILKKYQAPEDIGAIFDELSIEAQKYKEQYQNDKKIWHPKIDCIIGSCPVIVFIKGTPENPKCGFTRTLIEILKNHNIQFTYYDIIDDEYMRYWFRQYKNYPNYPQLYVNGKFLGGLDMIKQSIAKGEFVKEFPASSRQQDPEKKYNNLIQEHENIALVPKFSFESKQIENFLNQVNEKYPNLYVCNVSLDSKLSAYLKDTVKEALPFLVIKQKIVNKIE